MIYKNAQSIEECLAYLKEAKGNGRIIAGGTDLVLALRDGRAQAETLVDISRISALKSIKVENGFLVIGSAVTLNEIIKSTEVQTNAPILVKAAASIASVQVRNLATMVGNVVTANPEADCAMVLAALDAVFIINDGAKTREVGVMDMFDTVNKSSVNSATELVTEVRIPCAAQNAAAGYQRFALRRAMAPAILNSAVLVKVDQKKVTHARISMGPVSPVVTRALKAEAFLTGKELTPANIKEAARLAREGAQPLDNPFRGSAGYLKQVVAILIERALMEAAAKLGYNMQTA